MLFLRWLPRTNVAMLRDGRAVVEGRVVAARTLSITGSSSRPVWFDVTVESYRTGSRGRGRPMWLPKNADEQTVPFMIDDGTGTVWVAAVKGNYVVGGGVRREVGRAGARGTSRFVANLILPGDIVRVRGEVGEAAEGEVRREGELPGKVIRGSPEQPMEILFRRAARIPAEAQGARTIPPTLTPRDERNPTHEEGRAELGWPLLTPCAHTRVLAEQEKQPPIRHVFDGESLDGVDFSTADLREAWFEEASLRGCNFSRADLRGASFLRCDMRGADFTEALLEDSQFGGSWMIGARGLTGPFREYIERHGGLFMRRVDTETRPFSAGGPNKTQ